jgi:hypothetical protein
MRASGMATVKDVVKRRWLAPRPVIYRRVIKNRYPQFARLKFIRFLDGTAFTCTFRPVEPYERVEEIGHWTSLVEDALASGEEIYQVRTYINLKRLK